MGAVLSRRGRVISVGYNQDQKTHPAAKNWSRRMHAECDCIVGTDRSLMRNAIIWVYRETRDGILGLARPCKDCQSLLVAAGIREAVYTDPYGGYGILRLQP